jgi:hypothetical protein
MTAAVCPYCRGPIDPPAGDQLLCSGCGTPHHADCYADNGGCTIFGCTAGPAEDPKLSLSGNDLSNVPSTNRTLPVASSGGEAQAGAPVAVRPAKTPPPPPPPGVLSPPQGAPARPIIGSILFSAQPVPVPAAAQAPNDFDFVDDPNAKNRTTFIILGVLLGALGAHNFYAGYRKKAAIQLCLSLFTLGLASPMTWVWAVIDISTVDKDNEGIKFKS